MVLKYVRAVQLHGWRHVLRQMYTVGEIKIGKHVGTDTSGNKYYENREYTFGTHRWVEYADIHNYDSSTVTPTWHGWLHHMSDTPPTEIAPPKRIGLTTAVDNCPYDTHVGPEALEPMLNQNLTGFRPRGYGVGNLYQKWGEPELFYKQVLIAVYLALHMQLQRNAKQG
jgi:NADH:ubiquinone oxidoreductase subunit